MDVHVTNEQKNFKQSVTSFGFYTPSGMQTFVAY